MDIHAVVGLNVLRLRRERAYSQEEVALRSGCTRAYLSGLEAGRRNPTIETLAKLAKALNVEPAEFFLRPEKRPRKKREAVVVKG